MQPIAAIPDSIRLAITRSRIKYGILTPDLTRAFMIMTEEYGEVCKEMVDLSRYSWRAGKREGSVGRLREELAQLIGVCYQMMENIDGGFIR